jgi:NodT family efflux transporter outer membrane factor (OMF) lipoprotein
MTSHILRHMRTGLVLAAAGLGGCRLGPDYQPPAQALPDAWRAPATEGAAPSADWWRGFGSAELDGLMADALAGSFDIAAAIARVRQADAQIRVAGAALLPTVNGAAGANWTRSSVTTASVSGTALNPVIGTTSRAFDTRTYTLGPNASYQLDFWGGLRATQEAAAASALFSRYDRQTVTLTVLAGVANAWTAALAAQDRLDVAGRNLHDAEEILKAIQARQDSGVASLLDVSQQQALVAGIRATVPGLRQQRAQQVAALAVLVGRPPERIDVRAGTLTALTLPPVGPGLPSTLLARRPDVAAAEANLIAQNANIRAARAAFFPTVSLTGSAGWESAALNALISPQSLLLNAAANASQTIFDNGRLGGQYEQSRARYDELLADYRKTVVQALVDVENALTAWRETSEQEQLEREAVATAQRAADISRAQVEAGTLDIVTALQTQTTLFTDLDLLAQARLARVQALIALYQALGGGWTAGDVPPPGAPIFNGAL